MGESRNFNPGAIVKNTIRLIITLLVAASVVYAVDSSATRRGVDAAIANYHKLTERATDNLLAAYDRAIGQAEKQGDETLADELTRERDGILVGDSPPSETPRAGMSVIKFAPDALSAMEVDQSLIPDELEVEYYGRYIRLHGEGRVADANVDGRSVERIGRIIIFDSLTPSGVFKFTEPRRAERVDYYFLSHNKKGIAEVSDLMLEANKTYRFNVYRDGTEFKIKIYDGKREVLKSRRFTDRVVRFGIGATVRRVGDRADITVALD